MFDRRALLFGAFAIMLLSGVTIAIAVFFLIKRMPGPGIKLGGRP